MKVEKYVTEKLSTLNSQLSTPQGGQALLIVVLVMVVALTMGLSVASRSITNLRLATEQQDSQAAFSAAEAGIEQILKSGVTPANLQLSGKASIKNTTIQQVEGSDFVLNNGNAIAKDDGVDIWLVDHNADGSINFSSGWQQLNGEKKLTIYWGKPSETCSAMAAIEIAVLSGNRVAQKITRDAVDPCDSLTRRGQNKFNPPDEVRSFSRGGGTFAYRKEIRIDNNSKGIMVRVTPLFFSTPIAVRGCQENVNDNACTPFPLQGKVISSTGTSGETERKITYFQGYPKVPTEFFQYVLFSSKQ